MITRIQFKHILLTANNIACFSKGNFIYIKIPFKDLIVRNNLKIKNKIQPNLMIPPTIKNRSLKLSHKLLKQH